MRLFGRRSRDEKDDKDGRDGRDGRDDASPPQPGPSAHRPSSGPDDPRVTETTRFAVEQVYAGFIPLDEAIDRALGYFDQDPLPDADIEAIVARAWDERSRAIADADAASPEPDASSRLSAAFRALEDDGIVARMDFTCCQTCGHAEIRDERSTAAHERGYTFFHHQDSERIPDGELYLAFGPFGAAPELPADLVARAEAPDDTPERAAAREEVWDRSEQIVADTVALRLREAGLRVDWNGSTTARILVDVSDWRRPLPV